MPWTETTRRDYERRGRRYASDPTDGEWALITPFMPARKRPIVTDTLGLPIGLVVHGADVQDRDDAAALGQGIPPFADYGSVPLFAIVGLGDYLFVCRDDFPARRAWLVAEALATRRHVPPVALTPAATSAEPPDARLPLHPGARVFQGRTGAGHRCKNRRRSRTGAQVAHAAVN